MTPEEILAECPELESRFNMFGLVNFSHYRPNGDIEVVSHEVATAWSQARKEARELRAVVEDINSKIGIADKDLDILIKERDELKKSARFIADEAERFLCHADEEKNRPENYHLKKTVLGRSVCEMKEILNKYRSTINVSKL